MEENPNKLNTKLLFQNPYWKYYLDKYKTKNGNLIDYHYVSTNGSTMIIAKNKDKFIFTYQYRYLNNKYSFEFPGGGIGNSLSPIENAKKELLEETGFYSEQFDFLGTFNPFNGVTDEICSIFFTDSILKNEQSLEETEDIEVVELSEIDIDKLISTNKIWDGMTIASWYKYKILKGNS